VGLTLKGSPASFGLWRMTWDSRLLVCRACPTSAVKSTSGRPGSWGTSASSLQ
jgi:hypothetical protein